MNDKVKKLILEIMDAAIEVSTTTKTEIIVEYKPYVDILEIQTYPKGVNCAEGVIECNECHHKAEIKTEWTRTEIHVSLKHYPTLYDEVGCVEQLKDALKAIRKWLPESEFSKGLEEFVQAGHTRD